MPIRAGLLIAAVMLTGCAQQPIKAPEVVRVAVPVPVRVAPELTQPCPIAKPASNTVAEAVRVARARRAALEACNAQLDAIRKTQD